MLFANTTALRNYNATTTDCALTTRGSTGSSRTWSPPTCEGRAESSGSESAWLSVGAPSEPLDRPGHRQIHLPPSLRQDGFDLFLLLALDLG